jgi:hypothetical protein
LELEEVIWQGKIGSIMLKVGVPHAGRIVAHWETPQGSRQKVAGSMEEFERSVLLQLLLSAGETDTKAVDEVKAAVEAAMTDRPRPAPSPERKRRSKQSRQPRRSRRPPRRR